MNDVITRISLDIHTAMSKDIVVVKNHDVGRKILIGLTEGGLPYKISTDCRAMYAGKKPDGTVIYDSCVIDGNTIRLDVKEHITDVSGRVTVEVKLYGPSGQLITSPSFILQVDSVVYSAGDDFENYGTPTCVLLSPGNCKVGNFFRIASVGEDGISVTLESVDIPALEIDAVQLRREIEKRGNRLWKDPETGLLYLMSDDVKLQEQGVDVGSANTLAFDGGYVDASGYLHLTLNGEDIAGFTPFPVPTGGGGDGGGSDYGSRIVVSLTSGVSMAIPHTAESCNIQFVFSSVDSQSGIVTGNGTLKVYVNDVLKKTQSIAQGTHSLQVRQLLSDGGNTVKLVITDSYGNSAIRTVTVAVESLSLTWDLGETAIAYGDLGITFTPVGYGTKTIRIFVDGNEVDSFETAYTNRAISRIVSAQSHGGHIIRAQATMDVNGVTIESEVLMCAAAWVTGSTPVIACAFETKICEQYTTLHLPFRAIYPGVSAVDVTLQVNGVTYDTLTVDQSEQLWSYYVTENQAVTLSIICGNVEWTKTVQVNPLALNATEVTDRLEVRMKASTLSTLEGWEHNGYKLTLSEGFDTTNGGLQLDKDNVQAIKIMRGDRLTLNYQPFSTDSKATGKELKIIYRVQNSCSFDAEVFRCESGGIGITGYANRVVMRSEQTTMELLTAEDYLTELDLNIEPAATGRYLMDFWESGVPSRSVQYATNDNFQQSEYADMVFGSDECEVWLYLVRGYGRSLNDSEMMDNFVVDAPTNAAMQERDRACQIYDGTGLISPEKVAELNPEAHILTFHGASLSMNKDSKVKGYLTHKYVSGGDAHSWTAYDCKAKAQGTSALGYIDAALNQDFDCAEGFTMADGEVVPTYAMSDDAIGVSYFNVKVNVASSENVNNLLISDWYNRFQPHLRPARQENSKVRDCIGGEMCVLFFHNTSDRSVTLGALTVGPDETAFYGIGNMNNSKKNTEVFGQNGDDDVIVIEQGDNTSDLCRFKSDDLSQETFSGEDGDHFEFRYLDSTVSENEAKELFQQLLSFLVSTAADKASNNVFTSPVTYGDKIYYADTPSYRQAKFKAEASNYLIMDSILYHTLFTLQFSMVDNRSKNMFWGYSKKAGRWHLCFSYDHDTALGIDNQGKLSLRYGVMDYDVDADGNPKFNASDSTLFVNVWAMYQTELAKMYQELEDEGCWDGDAFKEAFDSYQEKICTALWMEDSYKKYKLPLINKGEGSYLAQLHGKKRLATKQFIDGQRQFIAAYFVDSFVQDTRATLRVNTPSIWSGVKPRPVMKLTAYKDTWASIWSDANLVKVRLFAGVESEEIDLGLDNATDAVVYLYNSDIYQDIGDLSCLYPKTVTLSNCPRLRRVVLGSQEEGYTNSILESVSVGNAVNLEYAEFTGCVGLATAFDFSGNIYLQELYAQNSGITGVIFANYGRLVTALLPAVNSITAKNLFRLATMTLEDRSKLSTLTIEGCPVVDSYSIVADAEGITRIRLKDIGWNVQVAAYKVLKRLAAVMGIDDDGNNTDTAVITGSVYFDAIGNGKFTELAVLLPQVVFTRGDALEEFAVRFFDSNDEVVYAVYVEYGDSVPDPVAAGIIPTPTKESSITTDYTFYGWTGPLSYITANTDLYPAFVGTDRQYTVRWFAGTEVVQTDILLAYESAEYRGENLTNELGLWTGWTAEAVNVTSNLDIHAVFLTPEMPSAMNPGHEYLYSDNPEDDSAYTLAQFYGIIANKAEKLYFAIGDKIKLCVESEELTDKEIVMILCAFKHYRLADGSDFAQTTWTMAGILRDSSNTMHSTGGGWDTFNHGSWKGSAVRTWLYEKVWTAFQAHWRGLIREVQVLASAGAGRLTILSCNDTLFLESLAELGGNVTTEPYCNEIDSEAEEVTFSVYTDNSSRQKNYDNNLGDTPDAGRWTRSPNASGSVTFWQVGVAGAFATATTYNQLVSFVFCI